MLYGSVFYGLSMKINCMNKIFLLTVLAGLFPALFISCDKEDKDILQDERTSYLKMDVDGKEWLSERTEANNDVHLSANFLIIKDEETGKAQNYELQINADNTNNFGADFAYFSFWVEFTEIPKPGVTYTDASSGTASFWQVKFTIKDQADEHFPYRNMMELPYKITLSDVKKIKEDKTETEYRIKGTFETQLKSLKGDKTVKVTGEFR